MKVGYARTSSDDQRAGLDAQVRELKQAGCQKIWSEQVSSVSYRVQLEAALDFVREGDTLVVSKLDRLARSTAHLLQIAEAVKAKGAGLRVLDLNINTGTATGK